MYRTSNQAYGSRAPTVHEMPVRRRQGRALGVCVCACVCVGVYGVCVCPGVPASQMERGHLKSFWNRDRVEIND